MEGKQTTAHIWVFAYLSYQQYTTRNNDDLVNE